MDTDAAAESVLMAELDQLDAELTQQRCAATSSSTAVTEFHRASEARRRQVRLAATRADEVAAASSSAAASSVTFASAPVTRSADEFMSTKCFADDPLRTLLPLCLIDSRVAHSLTPLPKELVDIIVQYAHAGRTELQLITTVYRYVKACGEKLPNSQTERFSSIRRLLDFCTPHLLNPGFAEDFSMLGWEGETYRGRSDEWDALLDSQLMRDEYIASMDTDGERQAAISAAGRSPRPVADARLYQRLYACLRLGRIDLLPPVSVTLEAVFAALCFARPEFEPGTIRETTLTTVRSAQYGAWRHEESTTVIAELSEGDGF